MGQEYLFIQYFHINYKSILGSILAQTLSLAPLDNTKHRHYNHQFIKPTKLKSHEKAHLRIPYPLSWYQLQKR